MNVTKSINSQANNKSPMVLQQSYIYFSIFIYASNCPLSIYMFMPPSKSLVPWVLLLELYLLYIHLYHNLGYNIYIAIIKNHMQTTLDAMIGENQSTGIKNRTILHTFSTTGDAIDVPHNLNSNLA